MADLNFSSLIKLPKEFHNRLKLNSVKLNYAYNHADSSSTGFQSAYVLDFLSSNFSMSLNQKFESINISLGNYQDKTEKEAILILQAIMKLNTNHLL